MKLVKKPKIFNLLRLLFMIVEMKSRQIVRISIISILIIFFIVLYFVYLVQNYIIPNYYEISILILLGFAVIIIGIIYFFLKINSPNIIVARVKTLNENLIKTILIILMVITTFIPAVSFSDVIIIWNEIPPLNYIRGSVVLVGALFIPGACIFNLIFPESTIHERLKVESFLIKITIYPLISLTYLGSITLILDFLGFALNIIPVLFFSIVFLYVLDLFFQKYKVNELKNKITEIKISRYTFLILFIGLGIVIIAIGILLKSHYLIAGDRWRAIAFATTIGVPGTTTFELADTYTKYWGCISFSLSVLCGIPYINTNVLLFPFLYLSITSSYLLIKALLDKMNEKYCILSSIFIAVFFQPMMLMVQFSFHSFAFFTLFLSLTLFFIVIKSSPLENKQKLNTENRVLLALSALFLVQSLMTYSIPALMGIITIFLYSMFSANKKHYLRVLLVFYGFFIIFFISFDLVALNFFSFWIIHNLSSFIGIPLHNLYLAENINMFTRLINSIRLYAFLLSILIVLIFIYYSKKNSYRINKVRLKKKSILEKKYKYLFVFIFILLLICILIASLDFTFYYRLLIGGKLWWGAGINSQEYFLIFYLSTLLGAIGVFGIIGIYLSYFCFKENKNLYLFLLSWIVLIIGLASLLIFLRWVQYPTSLVSDIPNEYYVGLAHWFTRTWYYSMIPLSILMSIGLIKLIKQVKSRNFIKLNKYQNFKSIGSLTLISLLIFLSFSNPITQVMYWDNYYFVPDEDAQMIGWITENVPRGSSILIGHRLLDFKHRLEGDLFLYEVIDLEGEMRVFQQNLSNEEINKLIDDLSTRDINYFILIRQNICDNYQKLIIQFYNKSDSNFPYSYGRFIIHESITEFEI